jgi:hypothetical protein
MSEPKLRVQRTTSAKSLDVAQDDRRCRCGKVNDLFDGELTGEDKLVYVNNVIKGKLLESEVLVQQATNNTKEQFANSPDLANGIMNAIIDAFAAHSTMSKQALDSEKVRSGLKDVLLGPAQLYEALRAKGDDISPQTPHLCSWNGVSSRSTGGRSDFWPVLDELATRSNEGHKTATSLATWAHHFPRSFEPPRSKSDV